MMKCHSLLGFVTRLNCLYLHLSFIVLSLFNDTRAVPAIEHVLNTSHQSCKLSRHPLDDPDDDHNKSVPKGSTLPKWLKCPEVSQISVHVTVCKSSVTRSPNSGQTWNPVSSNDILLWSVARNMPSVLVSVRSVYVSIDSKMIDHGACPSCIYDYIYT